MDDFAYTDGSPWDSLFAIAEDYGREEIPADRQMNMSETGRQMNMFETDRPPEKYESPEQALKVLFGYDAFRPGQKSVVDSILGGRDTFAVMPTGAGKSLCYQIPAMLLPGITLVVSPLISLMQDQVKALNEAGIAAAFINSSLTEGDFYETVERAARGEFTIIYVAPERLMTDAFLALSDRISISMVTVDEAHCISQWGQDFRPGYRKIVEFVDRLRVRPVISAFTATATETVREDIVCSLGLQNPFTLVTGFDRPNLFFQVERPGNKDQYILDYLADHREESGIIYCATRKNVDSLYELLVSRGLSAARYHAGMGTLERRRMQNDFVYDYKNIVVATNAFGMGIDKSNVRFVIHYNMPQSMENYYQEAGRAGRDGLDSRCILLFSPQDIAINRFLLDKKEISDLDPEDLDNIRERDNARLVAMEGYCYTTDCLRNYILRYFGEKPESPCGDCGNCRREFETLDMTEEAKTVINCVYEAKGRYGKTIIIDTVAGAKTARLQEIGATKYRTYGLLVKTNRKLLRRLMEELILQGYLRVGDYQVVKPGEIGALKKPDTRVLIRITEEDRQTEKTEKRSKQIRKTASLTSAGFDLFDRLKKERLSIARRENLPPYIVFSDRTLIDMAARVPLTRPEMLAVSGVGENKFEKYGDHFLTVIKACLEEYPELEESRKQYMSDLQGKEEKGEEGTKTASEKKGKKKNPKEEFALSGEEAADFCYAEWMTAVEIRDEINRICRRENVKKLPATRLVEVLTARELVKEAGENGFFFKSPTEKGYAYGIRAEDRVSEKGNHYQILSYPQKVQRLLVEHYTTL